MISMLYAVLIAFALVAATVVIHYEVLRSTWLAVPHEPKHSGRNRMMMLLAGIFLAHTLEIGLYALAYYLMNNHLGLGTIAGATGGGGIDYFYFSITCYTTLGLGDLYPSGPIRLVVGIEALNGFVLIGWSTSYTYLAMERMAHIGRPHGDPEGPTPGPGPS